MPMSQELPWLGLVASASYFATLLSARAALAFLIWPLRGMGDHPWYERARIVHTARAMLVMVGLLGAAVAALVSVFLASQLRALDVHWPELAWSMATTSAASAIVAAMVLRFRLDRRLEPALTRTRYLAGLAILVCLFLPVLLILGLTLLAGWSPLALPRILLLPVAALLVVAFAGGVGLDLLRLMGVARPPSVRLAMVMAEAASRAGVQPRAVYEVRWPAANALALIPRRIIVVSDTCLEVLDDDELRALMTHELAHLSEPLGSLLVRLASSAIALAAIAWLLLAPPMIPLIWRLAIALVLPLAFLARLGKYARSLEQRADALATEHQAGAETYARALEKLMQANIAPLVTWEATTHPQPYDRFLASGYQPPYARPEPPGRWRSRLALLLMLAMLIPLYLAVMVVVLALALSADGL